MKGTVMINSPTDVGQMEQGNLYVGNSYHCLGTRHTFQKHSKINGSIRLKPLEIILLMFSGETVIHIRDLKYLNTGQAHPQNSTGNLRDGKAQTQLFYTSKSYEDFSMLPNLHIICKHKTQQFYSHSPAILRQI